jgi:hypothetical protein
MVFAHMVVSYQEWSLLFHNMTAYFDIADFTVSFHVIYPCGPAFSNQIMA